MSRFVHILYVFMYCSVFVYQYISFHTLVETEGSIQLLFISLTASTRRFSAGQIAGIVIGCIVVVVIIVIIIIVIIKVAGKGTKVHPPTPPPGAQADPERQ